MCVLNLLAMSLNFSVSVINFCWDDLSTNESEVWTSRPVAVLVSACGLYV